MIYSVIVLLIGVLLGCLIWGLTHREKNEPATNRQELMGTLSQHLSLQPFHTIRLFANVLLGNFSDASRRSAIVNLVGNVILFLPLGFLPPLLWKSFQKRWKCLLWGGLIIICVEVCQLFLLVGNCDIDDLLLNLVGIAMGYGFYSLIRWIDERRRV